MKKTFASSASPASRSGSVRLRTFAGAHSMAETGFHLRALAELPAGASDISFYRDHYITHTFA